MKDKKLLKNCVFEHKISISDGDKEIKKKFTYTFISNKTYMVTIR